MLQVEVRSFAFQLRSSPVSKCLKNGNSQGIMWHGFVIESDEVTDDALDGIAKRDAKITDGAHFNHSLVFRENFRKTIRDVAGSPLSDLETGSAAQIVFKVFAQVAISPVRS